VELLDLGRSVYWQQASSLRSDLEALKEEDKQLANELETVGRKLDTRNISDSNFIGEGQSVRVNSKEVLGRERRSLANKWESLVERARQIPQFTYFRGQPLFANSARLSWQDTSSLSMPVIMEWMH
jgi:hypothetical protein